MNKKDIKKNFPIFDNHEGLVFLDNGSTTQKPIEVINAISEFYMNSNANVHRGLYPLSENATEQFEAARATIAKFINAEPEEIIFTSGTTEGINGIALSLYKSGFINERPKIVLTDIDHHSNVVPWQELNPEVISYLGLDDDFQVNNTNDSSPISITEFDLVAFPHISNVTGTFIDPSKFIKQFPNAYSVLDASQSIGHIKIDVKKLGVDFMVFSGHKMYSPMGIGVIYAKKEILKELEPFKTGGGMIREVTREATSWADLPERFEAGTPNVEGAIALAKACEFIEAIGFDEIEKQEQSLRKYLVEKLKTIPKISIYHPPLSKTAGGVVSFNIEGIHPHDIAQKLGEKNICVRAGHHCSQIVHKEVFKVPASVRVSLGIYNSEEDIDLLIDGLKDCLRMFDR